LPRLNLGACSFRVKYVTDKSDFEPEVMPFASLAQRRWAVHPYLTLCFLEVLDAADAAEMTENLVAFAERYDLGHVGGARRTGGRHGDTLH
jgi:hypothetical protein